MIIREALAAACADLAAVGIETPSLDASLLLAQIKEVSRTALTAMGNDSLSQENHAEFRALIQRRLNGECTAYILGKKEFRGLEFLVNPSVLVPRPDTETLVETALEILESVNDSTMRVLDLCTGSGAVAVSLKSEKPALAVCAADISAQALETAKANANLLLPENSIQFYQGDLYDALPHPSSRTAHCFNLIVCNPPYIPTEDIQSLPAEVRGEPLLALDGGPSGLAVIERVVEGAPVNLLFGGALLLEACPHQMKDIRALLEKSGFSNVRLYKDLSGQERVIGGIFEKD